MHGDAGDAHPFHTMVLALRMTGLKAATLSGPQSRPIQSPGMPPVDRAVPVYQVE